MHSGDDPFGLVKESMRVIKDHLGTFNLLEDKVLPKIVDEFGWCTWDAFYLKVHPAGVWEGVKDLVDGGCPPGFVIIDDGWQSICHDEDDPESGFEGMNRTCAGEQMPCRLIKFQENYKFREYVSVNGESSGMGAFVSDLKERFRSVEQVYVWHALCGYWGGIRPRMRGLPEARVVSPVPSPGLKMTMEDLAVDKIVRNGIGMVPPEMVSELYEGLHGHLASVGITGVKVDVIHVNLLLFFFIFFSINHHQRGLHHYHLCQNYCRRHQRRYRHCHHHRYHNHHCCHHHGHVVVIIVVIRTLLLFLIIFTSSSAPLPSSYHHHIGIITRFCFIIIIANTIMISGSSP